MQSQARVLTLSQAVLPQTGIVRDVLVVVAFSWFIALCAQIRLEIPAAWYASLWAQWGVQLPSTPVPITGQTMGVLLTGALLGSRRGAASLLAYLGQGAVGLPFFAGGSSGLAILFGAKAYTAGYLYGFVLAAFVVGYLAERGWDRNVWTTAAAMFVGNVLLYIPGLIVLGALLGKGVQVTLVAGLIPFIPGDLIKLVLAAIVLPSAWALVQRTPRS